MKTCAGSITLLFVMGCSFSGQATETILIPWHVVSSNRLTEIRQEFYVLPRPVIQGWQTVTQRGSVMFFGWSAEMEGTKLVLTTNATAFIEDNTAHAGYRFDGRVELSGALWPILLDTNHSGEATAILLDMRNSPFSVEMDVFLDTIPSWHESGRRRAVAVRG